MVQRLRRCSSQAAAAETIANIEGLLTEILVRVPARPLVRFKCVSRHWLALISNPKFCHRHTLQNPNPSVSAIFSSTSTDSHFIPLNHLDCDRDHDNTTSSSNHENQNPSRGLSNPIDFVQNLHGIMIMQSCNGLFLCQPLGSVSKIVPDVYCCYVLNPTTNQFLTLVPPASNSQHEHTIMGYALAFDPSKSPHYTVFCLETMDGSKSCPYYQMQIYSSETRSWRLLNSSFYRQHGFTYRHAVYSNGAIHWIGISCEMTFYRIDEELLEGVNLPMWYKENEWTSLIDRYFKESCGGLLHVFHIFRPRYSLIDLLEMGRDYSGWFLKYRIDLHPICTIYPRFQYSLLFLAPEDNQQEECSSLLLHTPGKVISYNLKTKTLKSFELTPKASNNDLYLRLGDHNYRYMETLACV